MAMGTRKDQEQQEEMWIPQASLAKGASHLVLSALEPTAGGMPLRRVRGGAVPAVLCGEAGAAQLAAGGVLPAAADWLPRGYRFGAWDRLAES